MGLNKSWYEVRCTNNKHGSGQKGLTGKFVKVGAPDSRFEQNNKGCPFCRAEGSMKPDQYNKIVNYREEDEKTV